MPDWRDMSDEISQHVEDRYRELRAQGVAEPDARRLAAAERSERVPTGALAAVAADVRFGARMMRRQPAFTAVVVATLAIGIGANAAIFSVVDAAVLRPLPYPDADRLVVIWGNLHRPGVDRIPGSAGEFVDYRSRARALEDVAAYDTAGFNLTGAGEPERIDAAIVSPSLFALLGASAVRGRTFAPDEEQPGRGDVVLISQSLWARRFGSDPAVIGRTVSLDSRPMRVVGVMPVGFQFPDATTELWTPLVLDAEALSANNRGSHGLTVLARLRAGSTLADAEADLNALAGLFPREHPNNYRNGFSVALRLLQDEVVGSSRRGLLILLGAVGVVLMIACGNVAALQLARGAARQKEVAVRTALGANRRRVVQQLLTESLLVATAGGAAGLLVARWILELLTAAAPGGVPRLADAALDGPVVAFTAIVSIATGLVFGVLPALRVSRPEVSDVLKESGRGGAPPLKGNAGRFLLVAELALSVVLLVAAGLLTRSFANVQDVRPGFDSHDVLTFRLSLPASRYTTFEAGEAFFDRLVRSLESGPGIVRAAAIDLLPFGGSGGSRSFYIAGREIARPADQPEEQLRIVTEGYFATMRIPVVAGREFSARDSAAAPRVAIVNESFAQKHFADGRAIGSRISFSRSEPRWYEIVGIVGDVKHRGLDVSSRPELYVPYRQPLFESWTVRPMYFVVRTAVDPSGLVASVRRTIAAIDPEQPISDAQTMEARLARSLNGRRFTLLLLGAFAAFALLLAGIGIYAVVAFSVHARTHEIGIRMALGARRGDVLRMIIAQVMSLAALGTAAGVAGALALTRLLRTLLFGVSPFDPATFAAIPLLLLATAFAAAYLPARRATLVDPTDALRME